MVAAVSTALNTNTVAQTPRVPHSQNLTRPPLLPSDSDNGAAARRPKSREVTSRYLSSSTPSSSSTSVLRRYPSPSVSGTSTSTSVLTPMPSSFRRSESVERTQRGAPHPNSLDLRFGHANGRGEMSAAQKLLFNSTRSLSVSFQGESFPLQVSRPKPAPTPGIRKGTPEPRKIATPTRGAGGGDQTENMKPVDQQRWHSGHRQTNCMSRSLDCVDERKKVASGSGNVVRALQSSFVDDRTSFDGRFGSDSANIESEKAVEPLTAGTSADSLDVLSDPLASDSESVTLEGGAGKAQRGPRVMVVPARVWQETNNRLRRQPEPGYPISKNIGAKTSVPSKVNIPKKHSMDSPASSPRQVANNMEPPSSPLSPSKLLASSISSPSKGSPSRVRCSVTNGFNNNWSSTPSALNFANDIRRGKMGDTRMADAHSLKTLYNRLLQWRFVNARADATSSIQSLNAERNLFSAWNSISKLRESVAAKRHEMQLLQHKLKLASILKSQMTCLDELDLLDEDFSSSLSDITEALEARTLRLPVDEGAKAEIQDVKEAICSAVDVMQAMVPSLSSWLTKVGEVNSVVSKLADVNAHERALLDQCNDLLSTVASMQVTECSLRTQILQLERPPTSLTEQDTTRV
ncbi:QWRF motif-containing protein 2-like [Cucurbita maxima]|uniref:QWRF motif-containing protein 2-like n=1 Tax=Cucurbita maxima TaxID=3661 RepID=A0A6J1KPJ9_CUCMA|nr:QWRF motif-containing protein 2-like [Cucurbita maxima]XP_023002125.1 QWRF motif-containing protein 2-like [Cucurbita maxima]